MLDLACGTGLTLASLRAGVGPQGRVIGVDLSPEMLSIARERIRAASWQNVELIEAAVQDAALPLGGDAALFSFAHDVLQEPAAIDRVLASLRQNAVIVAAGAMEPWLPGPPRRSIARRGARRHSTTPEALARPWTLLANRADIQRIRRPLPCAGAIYLVRATAR